MLSQIGAVQFAPYPFNSHENEHNTQTDFAEKAVMGAMPPLEFTGEAAERWTIKARLFPYRLGGLSSLEALHAIRRAGKAQPYVRGDGSFLGWVVVESVRERSTYLSRAGVGKMIECDITVRRAGPAPLASLYSILVGIFS